MNNITNKFFIFIGVVVCIAVLGCHFNSTYNNRDIDKQEGEKVIAKFYELVKNENYQVVYPLFSEKFFSNTDTQRLNYIFKLSLEKLGTINNYSIETWETQAVIGTDPKTDYLFLCNVKRSNFISQETLTLAKEDGEIRIVGYHVNSEGFFQKN